MGKTRKSIIVLIAVFVIAATMMIGAAIAFAADQSDTLDLITSVSLTDRDGNPLGANIPRDSELKLTYEYAIPNTATVLENDTFTLNIPQEIAITAPGGFELVDNESGQVIGNGTIAVDGTLVITFTNFVEEYSNIHGNFWFDLAFDDSKIGYDDPTVITFEVGASTDPYTIEIDFDQPAPPEATIEKSGSFNAATKEITWTVTVDPEEVVVGNAVVTDTIAAGQTFVPGSVTINGSAADTADYTYDVGTSTLTYTFPGTISSEQILTLKTTVDDSEFSGSTEGATLTEHNTAELTRDGGGAVSNDATITTTVDFIRKSGSYDGANKRINWTIVVNSNYVTIPDAVITDIIPAGLTYEPTSLLYDGGAFPVGTNITYIDPALTIELGQSISEPHTITFYTDVDADFYELNQSHTFTNSVTITGAGVPGGAADSRGIGVTSTVVSKSGIGYNRALGQISWRVTVNSNNINIENCYVTDEIRVGQELVPGSVRINGLPAIESVNYTYTAADPGDLAKTGALSFLLGDISVQISIEFTTQVTDPAVFMSNASVTYRNTVKMGGDNIPESSREGTQTVTSNVIRKTSTSYNYDTREITWRIVVDENNMAMGDVVVTDNIRLGQEYVEDSLTIDGAAPDPADFSHTPLSGDPDYSGTVVYTFDGPISEQHIITFKTRIYDLSIFATNGDKTLQNSASLVHSLLPGGVTSTGSRTVHNTVISKTGAYTAGNKFIDWTIIINTNTVPLSDAIITDTFQEGLALDTNTLELIHMDVNTDGTLTPGSAIELAAGNVHYDISSRTLTFTIPAPVSGAYRLTFRTNVTDIAKSPFTNSASFAGTGTEQEGTSTQIAVSWAGSGSTGTGETGSIRVYKVDSEDDTKTLEGCTFELVDRYGNVVQQGTTNSDGYTLFEMLRFDVNYTVRELTPPEGYLISDEEYTFQIDGAGDDYDIEYNYADDAIKGNISLHKYDLDMKPIPGTGFTLYADGDTEFSAPLLTVLSDEDGMVVFENVPYGSYAIKETAPAPGYYGSDAVLTVTIDTDGETVQADPGYIQNEVYRGSIRVLKTTEDGQTPLEGAVIGLYLPEDTEFIAPVAQGTSDEFGEVLFEDIPYGDYVIREISAPLGYVRTSETIEVSVMEDGMLVDAGVFENRRPTSPETGDDIYLYVALFTASLLGLTVLAITRRYRRTKRAGR